jgi:hypothetical protein
MDLRAHLNLMCLALLGTTGTDYLQLYVGSPTGNYVTEDNVVGELMKLDSTLRASAHLNRVMMNVFWLTANHGCISNGVLDILNLWSLDRLFLTRKSR